ncbi:MAG: metallopeptidase family protein [Verrucomicrobia bacterium]|nr:metallopeptidase family protein [Verrucomicrobiota bacterium]
MHWPEYQELIQLARQEVDHILARLPAPLSTPARQLPLVFEPEPGADLVADGIDPDTLGLFVGVPHNEGPSNDTGLPPQIILYLDNLWAESEGNASRFQEEVRTTFLHELGHYLGLDESDLDERGLG